MVTPSDAHRPRGEEGRTVVPRWLVSAIVLVLTILLTADVLAQFVVAGHEASPVLDAALLTILGGVVAGARGPKPGEQATDPPALVSAVDYVAAAPPAAPGPPSDGRHRATGERR